MRFILLVNKMQFELNSEYLHHNFTIRVAVNSDIFLFILDSQWYFDKIVKHNIRNMTLIGINCVGDLREQFYYTDANNFLKFIHIELIPYLQKHLTIKPIKKFLFGHSLAAAYALYDISTSSSFDYYIIAIPCRNLDILNDKALLSRIFIGIAQNEKIYPDIILKCECKVYKNQEHRFSAIASIQDFMKFIYLDVV
jgi:hypothetical protein